jgi:maleylpyruvate isomerase
MSASPDRMLPLIDTETERLLTTVRRLTDDDVRQPSLLPGWTRGHVLTHLARGPEAMRRLLDGVRTGVPGTAYPSQEARDRAIEEGAGRSAAELLADVESSAHLFRDVVVSLPEESWQQPVHVLTGAAFPAAQLLERRLVEVVLHHTDLGAGYGVADWPEEFVYLELGEPMRSQRESRLAEGERPASR